jgi:hypothetical protein
MFGIWLFSGKLLMEFDWQDITDESTVVAELRNALAENRTGPQLKPDPCMMNETTVDLDLRLDGPFPVGLGRDVVMQLVIFSDALMVDRVYLGPPTRQVSLNALPVCLATPDDLAKAGDPATMARISLGFFDLDGRRFNTFSGEEAFPILAWRKMRVDWSVMPWQMPDTENLTQIMVTPL